MAVAGQGSIESIKSKTSTTNKTENHVIDFNPHFTWKIKTIPTKVPDSGAMGGAIYFDSNRKKDNKDDKDSHQTLFITGVGYGAGGIVPSASGPVLMGAVSLSSFNETSLWIIAAMLLLILAIIWAVIHLILFPSSDSCCASKASRKVNKDSADSKEIWSTGYHGMFQSHNRNDHMPLIHIKTDMSENQTVWSFTKNENHQFQSLNKVSKDYLPSVHMSTHGSVKPAGIRSPSSMSSWSFQTSLADNISVVYNYMNTNFTYNQLAKSQSLGAIFTVSELNCPYTWNFQEGNLIEFCEPSKFSECLEVFLLNQETLLVGKMKNLKFNGHHDDYAIQIWRTSDGMLDNIVPDIWNNQYVTCDAVCPIHDEFLVFIQRGDVIVWNIKSNRILSSVPLKNIETTKVKHSIQVSRNLSDIVIMSLLPASGSTHLYVFKFDQLLRPSPSYEFRSFPSQKSLYSLISETCILIAGSTSNDIIMWNFKDNSETIHNRNDGEIIHRILNSPTGNIFLFQLTNGISIWSATEWIQLSYIPVSSSTICSMAFSSNANYCCYFAIAQEDGSIYIYNVSDGQLLASFKTNIPIVYMTFTSDNYNIIAMADRASHYQLFIYKI